MKPGSNSSSKVEYKRDLLKQTGHRLAFSQIPVGKLHVDLSLMFFVS